jgi:hypothetical protein
MNSNVTFSTNKQEENKLRVQVRCKTWSRDSHGLFDYENNHVYKNSLTLSNHGDLIRMNNTVHFYCDSTSEEENKKSNKQKIKINYKDLVDNPGDAHLCQFKFDGQGI